MLPLRSRCSRFTSRFVFSTRVSLARLPSLSSVAQFALVRQGKVSERTTVDEVQCVGCGIGAYVGKNNSALNLEPVTEGMLKS